MTRRRERRAAGAAQARRDRILLGIRTLLGILFAYVVPYALDPEDSPGGVEQFFPESLPGTLVAGFPFLAVSSL